MYLMDISFSNQLFGRFTNAFGLVSLGYLAVLAIVYAKPSLDSASLWPVSWVGMLARFPVFMFAFMCHHNFFQVAEEMPKVTIRKLNIVSVSAVTTGLVIFLPTMVLPYMTYGPDVGGENRSPGRALFAWMSFFQTISSRQCQWAMCLLKLRMLRQRFR